MESTACFDKKKFKIEINFPKVLKSIIYNIFICLTTFSNQDNIYREGQKIAVEHWKSNHWIPRYCKLISEG